MCSMFTRSRLPLFAVALLLLATTGLVAQQGADTGDRERRIAFFGSSVPNGTGDETGHGGYTGRMRTLLEPRGWEVLNRSRGGDNTVTIAPRFEPEGAPDPDTRYLTTVDPGYAVPALAAGKPLPVKSSAPGFVRVRRGSAAPLAFSPAAPMRSFAVSFLVRPSGNGTVAPVVGQTLDYSVVQREYGRRRQLIDVYNPAPPAVRSRTWPRVCRSSRSTPPA